MAAAAEKKKNVSEEQLPQAAYISTGSAQRFIPPLNMLIKEDAIDGIMVKTFRVTESRLVQQPGLAGLPTVHEKSSYSADILVNMTLHKGMLQMITANCKVEETDDDEDEKPVVFILGPNTFLHVHVEEGVASGDVILEVRNAATSDVHTTEMAIVENERFLKLCNMSEDNLEKLNATLQKMSRIIQELSKEESTVSVDSLDTEDEILSGISKGMLRGAMVEAGSLEQRRAEKRRNELTQTLETHRARLEAVVFGKAGERRALLNPNEGEIPEEAAALFGAAMQMVINEVET